MLSLVARAAGMRDLSTASFCAELGLSYKKLLVHDPAQISRLVELLGLDQETREEVQSWSLVPLPGVKTRFRNETYVSRTLMKPVVRGCPACLRDNVTNTSLPPAGQMVMQGQWQVKYVHKCLIHKKELVPLWEVRHPRHRFDHAARLKDLSDDILNGRLSQCDTPITDYDIWLDERLDYGKDSTWLANHDTEIAANFCTLLGVELKRVAATPKLKNTEASLVGFNVAKQGPEEILSTLKFLASAADGPQDRPKKAFGALYTWLSQYGIADHRWDAFRDLMREVILGTWAIPEGEVVLGNVLQARQLHSIDSAAREIGRSNKVTREILTHKKLISADDTRTDTRLTFDAKCAAPVLSMAKRLVMNKQMMKHLGATPSQFETLTKQRVLVPALPTTISKLHWDTADADALLKTLLANPMPVNFDDSTWVTFGVAAGRARVVLNQAIKAVDEGTLRVGTRAGKFGYAAIVVKQSEMDALRPEKPQYPTLVQFGLTVGLKEDGALQALFEAGKIQTTSYFNPETLKTGIYCNDEDQAAFHAQFTTLKLLSKLCQKDNRSLARELRSLGVTGVEIGNRVLTKVFWKKDIERVIRLD